MEFDAIVSCFEFQWNGKYFMKKKINSKKQQINNITVNVLI